MRFLRTKTQGRSKKNFWRIDGTIFVTDGEHLYYCTHLPKSDYSSFLRLNAVYSQDANNVYYCGRIIKDANPKAFQIISRYMARDDRRYYRCGEAWKCDYPLDERFTVFRDGYAIIDSSGKDIYRGYAIDLATYQPVDGKSSDWYSCYKDKNHVYTNWGTILEGADPGTFERIEKTNFYKDKRCIYFAYDDLVELSPMKAVDPESFALVSSAGFPEWQYSRDKTHVYNGEHLIEHADPSTFVVLSEDGFAKDMHHVYYDGKVLDDAEANSIELIGVDYAKDERCVYYRENKLKDADPKSFRISENFFAYDKCRVWGRDNRIIKGMDIASLTFVGHWWCCDKNKVVGYTGNRLKAEPSSFQHLWGGYAKDKKHVFRYDDRIDNADPDTFTSLSTYYTKDKRNVYYCGERIKGADPDSFRVIEDNNTEEWGVLRPCYAADKNKMYFENKVIGGVDKRTFRIMGDRYSCDQYDLYYKNKRISI